MTYQNSKFDLDPQKIAINCVPPANFVDFFTSKHGSLNMCTIC